MGNISGMYIDEDDAKMLKMSNSMLLTNQKDYYKASEIINEAVEEQNEIKEKARLKELAKKNRKKDKNQKKGA